MKKIINVLMKNLTNIQLLSKIIIIVIFILIILSYATGCACGNKEIWDMTYTYDKAICKVADEWKEIKISKWTDYDGEQIQIWDKQGNYYLMSSVNCTLIKGE